MAEKKIFKTNINFICTVLSICAVLYTLWYMHFGPLLTNSGALSKTGLIHPVYFTMCGLMTYIALSANTAVLCRRLFKTHIYILPITISGIGMALTLCCDFDYDKRIQYYLHCGGSLTFSIVMGITVFLIYCINYKKSLYYKLNTITVGLILAFDAVMLLIYKETALIEAAPIITGLFLTTVSVNIIKENKKIAA